MDYFRNKPKRPVRTLAAHLIGSKMASAYFHLYDAKMRIFRSLVKIHCTEEKSTLIGLEYF